MLYTPKQELKRFFDRSSHIKNNLGLPIQDYVKIEGLNKDECYITRIGSNGFCRMRMDGVEFKKNFSVLVEFKTLKGAVEYGNEPVILIKELDDKISINCGRDYYCRKQDVKLFSVIDDFSIPQEGKILIPEDLLSSISSAKAHTLPITDNYMVDFKNFVSIKKMNGGQYWLIGTKGYLSYFKKIEGFDTEFYLSPEIVSTIEKRENVSYCPSEKIDYFEYMDTVLGFNKYECKIPDVSPVINGFEQTEFVSCLRKELLSFVNSVLSIKSSSVSPKIKISTYNGHQLNLSFDDISGVNGQNESIKCMGDLDIPESVFDADYLKTMLSSIHYDEIRLSKSGYFLIIKSEEDLNYKGVVGEEKTL